MEDQEELVPPGLWYSGGMVNHVVEYGGNYTGMAPLNRQ